MSRPGSWRSLRRLAHGVLFALAFAGIACVAPSDTGGERVIGASQGVPPVGHFLSPSSIGATPEFASASEPEKWAAGNQMVFGISLSRDELPRQWLVRMTLLSLPDSELSFTQRFQGEGGAEKFESRAMRVELATFDADGQQRETGVYGLPADYLALGLYDGAALAKQLADRNDGEATKLQGEELNTIRRSLSAWLSFAALVQQNASLQPILDEVIAKPSIWKVLANGMKLHVGVAPDLFATRVVAGIEGIDGEVLAVPFEFTVYDSPALVGTMYIAPCRSPIRLTGGVVGLEASHPADPDRAVFLRLLSAR